MRWGVGPEKLRILVEVRSGQSGFEETYKPKITSVQTHTMKIDQAHRISCRFGGEL